MDKKIRYSDVSILSAHDVDTKILIDFYNIIYASRLDSLPNIWEWRNRSLFYDKKIPIVILYNNRVIAHLGIIPLYVSVNGKYHTATIGFDLEVLPEFQRCGLGSLLVRKWMELSEIYIGSPNEQAIGIYKKYEWIESFNLYLHHYPLKPFNHPKFINIIPKFIREFLNILFKNFIYVIYRKYACPIENISLKNLNPDLLNKFIFSKDKQNNIVKPVRDSEYVSWRLLNSPDKENYRVFSIRTINDVSMIVKLNNNYNSNYIDILWVSDPLKFNAVRHIISTLAIWGMINDYSYIRFFTSIKELSNFLRKYLKPIVSQPRFTFYSKDSKLLNKLEHSKWHLELIDSDMEWV